MSLCVTPACPHLPSFFPSIKFILSWTLFIIHSSLWALLATFDANWTQWTTANHWGYRGRLFFYLIVLEGAGDEEGARSRPWSRLGMHGSFKLQWKCWEYKHGSRFMMLSVKTFWLWIRSKNRNKAFCEASTSWHGGLLNQSLGFYLTGLLRVTCNERNRCVPSSIIHHREAKKTDEIYSPILALFNHSFTKTGAPSGVVVQKGKQLPFSALLCCFPVILCYIFHILFSGSILYSLRPVSLTCNHLSRCYPFPTFPPSLSVSIPLIKPHVSV